MPSHCGKPQLVGGNTGWPEKLGQCWDTIYGAIFPNVIGKAMAACAGNHLEPSKHFVETGKMVELGSDANRQVVDYFLSRPACYLIAMNGDPTKIEIAGAQAYFAVQTRRMEIQDQRLQDEKRVELRERVSGAFKRVSGVAKQAGVPNNKQPIFHDARARGLYHAGIFSLVSASRGTHTRHRPLIASRGSSTRTISLFCCKGIPTATESF